MSFYDASYTYMPCGTPIENTESIGDGDFCGYFLTLTPDQTVYLREDRSPYYKTSVYPYSQSDCLTNLASHTEGYYSRGDFCCFNKTGILNGNMVMYCFCSGDLCNDYVPPPSPTTTTTTTTTTTATTTATRAPTTTTRAPTTAKAQSGSYDSGDSSDESDSRNKGLHLGQLPNPPKPPKPTKRN